MTKQRLYRNLDFLKVLSKARKRQRSAILSTADHDLILCLCDCALNILNGNVMLNSNQYEKLKKYKLAMRKLIDKSIKPIEKQNIIINQRGGFLPILLTPILAIAGQLLADILNKK